MNFKRFYVLMETVFKNWQVALSQSEELRVAVELMNKINQAGYEALIVGGSVRDLILGKIPNDFDLTTNANPDQVEKIFGKTIDIGKNKAMGVSVLPYKGFQFEIATYRKDLYSDNGKGLGADKVELTTSFKDDASRRDLTINQIGIDKDGNIIDHHNGLRDIENKIISTVGDPNLRFKEDQIRTMRAVRFASRLGFNIDQKTIDAIKSNASEIKKVASERVLKEIMKMAEQTGDRFASAMVMLKETGLLKEILPELDVMSGFEHTPEHHPEGHVWSHTIAALRTYKGNDPVVNLSILLHDVGKPVTYALTDKGTHSYHGHEEKAQQIIEKIAGRLKFDNATKDAVIFAAINHMKYFHILEMSNNKVAKLLQSPYFKVLEQTALSDASSRGNLFDRKEWDDIQTKIEKIKNSFNSQPGSGENPDIIKTIQKKFNGKYIMDLTGLKQGPKLGEVIDKTVEFILDNELNINSDMDVKKIDDFIISLKD